jgi:hypothetical protein
LSEQDKLEFLTRSNSKILTELDIINKSKMKCDLKLGDIMKALDEAPKFSGSNSGNHYIGNNYLDGIISNIEGIIKH